MAQAPDNPPLPHPSPVPAADPARWVQDYGDSLWRFALSRVRKPDIAEELIQETFAAALSAKDRFAGQSAELTWLTGILNHKIMDHFRRQSRREKNISGGDEGEQAMDRLFDRSGHWTGMGEINGPTETLAMKLNDCINNLPENLSSAFVLREVRGVPSEEVCQVLGLSATNLWTRLSRARALLRECLQRKGETGGPERGDG